MLPADLPVQGAGVGLLHRLLDGEDLYGEGAGAEAQGDLVTHLHIVGGPGRLAVDQHQPVVAGLVGHRPPLDQPGDLQIFVQTHKSNLQNQRTPVPGGP